MCLDIVGMRVDGGMAYVHDLWTVKSGGRTREVLRSFEIWRRNAAGDWRITEWISYPEPEPSRLQGRACK